MNQFPLFIVYSHSSKTLYANNLSEQKENIQEIESHAIDLAWSVYSNREHNINGNFPIFPSLLNTIKRDAGLPSHHYPDIVTNANQCLVYFQ